MLHLKHSSAGATNTRLTSVNTCPHSFLGWRLMRLMPLTLVEEDEEAAGAASEGQHSTMMEFFDGFQA